MFKELEALKKYIEFDYKAILIALGIMAATWVLQQYVLRPLAKRFIKFLTSKNSHFHVHVVECYEVVVRYALLLCSIIISIFIMLGIPIKDQEVLASLVRTVIIFSIFIGIYRLLGFYANNPMELSLARKTDKESVLLPFFFRFMKFVAIGIAFVFTAYEWGYDINGLIAGLGIGSLALALGAKDVLSNLFGGMAVAIDKPFSKGDWISTADRTIEGVVEEINFRSTKILTFDKALLYVPNTFLANQPIINWTRREVRRFMFQLSIDPSASEISLRKAMLRIQTELDMHSGVQTESASVFVDEFTEVGLMLKVVYFTNTAEFKESMHIKQEVNFLVSRIIQDEGVKLTPVAQQLQWNRVV